MAELKEQHLCIKFILYLGKTALEMHEMLTIAFGDNAMVKHRLLISFLSLQTWGSMGVKIVC